MACENPLKIPNPRYSDSNIDYWREYFKDTYNLDFLPDRYIEVPCGKCFSCQRSRLNGYRLRLMSEFERFPNAVFVTLTFDEDSYRRFRNDPNKAVRLFLDRFRKFYGKGIRHWIVGEYGEKTGRFHYHGIFFNVPPGGFDPLDFRNLWQYGHIWLGWCNVSTINYIVKYITKQDHIDCRKPPRIISSKGIGENFVHSKEAEYLKSKNQNYVSVGGYGVALPRYLLTKIYDYDTRILNQLCAKHVPFKRKIDGKTYYSRCDYLKALKRYSDKLNGLGISQKPLNLHFCSKLRPIEDSDVRYLDPFNPYDFKTKTEKSIEDSYFGLSNDCPF